MVVIRVLFLYSLYDDLTFSCFAVNMASEDNSYNIPEVFIFHWKFSYFSWLLHYFYSILNFVFESDAL